MARQDRSPLAPGCLFGNPALEFSPGSSYIFRFLDDPGPIKSNLQPARYTTARDTIYGSLCEKRHGNGSLACGLLRNSDASREASTASTPPWLALDRSGIWLWLVYSIL